MKDGLYRVCQCGKPRGICAGFAVRNGRIVAIAPVLRKRIAYWKTVAERVCG